MASSSGRHGAAALIDHADRQTAATPIPGGAAHRPTVYPYPERTVQPLPPDSGQTTIQAAQTAEPVVVITQASAASDGRSPSVWSATYAVLRVMPSLSDVDSVSRSPPAPIRLEDDQLEFVAAAAVALGYDWWDRFEVPLRTELEYRYRYHFDLESRGASTNSFYDASTS